MNGPMLRYRPTPDAPWTVIQFPPDTDPFAVLAEVEARLFAKQVVEWQSAKRWRLLAARKRAG